MFNLLLIMLRVPEASHVVVEAIGRSQVFGAPQ